MLMDPFYVPRPRRQTRGISLNPTGSGAIGPEMILDGRGLPDPSIMMSLVFWSLSSSLNLFINDFSISVDKEL